MPQSDLKRLFNNKVAIFRQELTEDEYGGDSVEWVRVSWNVPCRTYQKTLGAGQNRLTVQGNEYLVTDVLICEGDVDIRTGDKLIDEMTYSVYVVAKILLPHTSTSLHHKEAYISRTEESAEELDV